MSGVDEEKDSSALPLGGGGGRGGKKGLKVEAEAVINVEEIEEILGYTFIDEKLLVEALTHSSFYPVKSSISYERLEYIGDSVLNLLFARELFYLYPDLPPGDLTKLRAANVDTEKLARVAVRFGSSVAAAGAALPTVRHGLYHYLRHRAPRALEEQILEFRHAIFDYPVHSNGLIDTPKVLADIVESIIGAVFVDTHSSLERVWQVFKGLLEPMITLETLGTHPMTELTEFCQKKRIQPQPRFEEDPCSENTTFNVFVNDNLVGTGTATNKEIAQNRAAKAALENLKATSL